MSTLSQAASVDNVNSGITSKDTTEPKTVYGDDSVITELSELNDVNDEDFPEVFLKNIAVVYQYAKADVIETIQTRELIVLSNLRHALNDQLQELFPAYIDRVLINRKVKHTLLDDIFILGACICNKAIDKDIEKIYTCKRASSLTPSVQSSGNAEDINIEDLAQMIQAFVDLRRRVAKLEDEVRTLRGITSRPKGNGASSTQSAPTGPAGPSTRSKSHPVLACAVTDRVKRLPTDNDQGPNLQQSSASASPSSSDSESESDRLPLKQKRRSNKKSLSSSSTEHATSLCPAPADENVDLRAADVETKATKSVYLGNVHPNCTIKSICGFLRSKNIEIDPAKVTSLANGKKRSFRIDVSPSQATQLLSKDATLFPKGLKVRRFHPSTPPNEERNRDTQKSSWNHKQNRKFKRFNTKQHARRPPQLREAHAWREPHDDEMCSPPRRIFHSRYPEGKFSQGNLFNNKCDSEWYYAPPHEQYRHDWYYTDRTEHADYYPEDQYFRFGHAR